jgi:transposase
MYAYYYMRGGYDKTYKTSPFRYWNTGLGVMRARYNDQTQYSWTISCAKYMFENSRGMCYEWAAAYLYMARRLGFQSYLVVGNVFSDRSATDAARHCWAMIKWDGKWHISDVELEWGYISSYYTQTSTYWNLFEQTLAMEYLSYYENPECSTIKYIFKDESDMYS